MAQQDWGNIKDFWVVDLWVANETLKELWVLRELALARVAKILRQLWDFINQKSNSQFVKRIKLWGGFGIEKTISDPCYITREKITRKQGLKYKVLLIRVD